MSMKLGIGSYTYTWAAGVPGQMPERRMTAMDICRRAEEMGVKVVQLCENVPMEWDDFTSVWDWICERHDFAVELGARGLHDGEVDARISMVDKYGGDFIRLVVDSSGHEPTPDEVIVWLQETINLMRPGMRIALENHDRFPAQVLVKIIEEAGPDRVGITLDTVNSFGALEGPQHVVETLAPYVLSLHIKDFTIRRVPSQMGFVIEGCPAGQGRLDIPWLLSVIRDAGRDPNAIIELWTPPAETLEATIAREAEWAKMSVDYMRTLIPD